MEQFTSNSSNTANPLLKKPNPTVLYLILREGRKESGGEEETGETVRSGGGGLERAQRVCVRSKSRIPFKKKRGFM